MLLTWISMFVLACQLNYCISQYSYYQAGQENKLSWPYRQVISQPVGIPTQDLHSNMKYLNTYQPGNDNTYSNGDTNVNDGTGNNFQSVPTDGSTQETYPLLNQNPNIPSVNDNGYGTETGKFSETRPVGAGSEGRSPQESTEYLIMPSINSQSTMMQQSGISHLTQRDSGNYDARPQFSDQMQQVPEKVENQGIRYAEDSGKTWTSSDVEAQHLPELDEQARDVPIDNYGNEKYLDRSPIEWENQGDKLQVHPSDLSQPSTGKKEPTHYWDHLKPQPVVSNIIPTKHYSEQMYPRPIHIGNLNKPIVQTLYSSSNDYPQHPSANEVKQGNIDQESPTVYESGNNQDAPYARIKKSSSDGAAPVDMRTTDFTNVERGSDARKRHQPGLDQHNKDDNQAELDYLTAKIRSDIGKMENEAHQSTHLNSNEVWRRILKHQPSNLQQRSVK